MASWVILSVMRMISLIFLRTSTSFMEVYSLPISLSARLPSSRMGSISGP